MKQLTLASLVLCASFLSVACKQVKQVEEMHSKTIIMSENTTSMANTTASMAATTATMSQSMSEMLATTATMSENTAQMAATTASMAATTASMSQTTQNMELLTEDLRELSAWMFNILKQGDTSRLRDEAIKDMMDSESFTRKSLMATKYFYAFEYQIWNSPRLKANVDTLQLREKLKAGAVIEFAKTLGEFIPQKRKETGTSNDEEMKNLYALVGTLHKVNDYQEDLIRGTNTTATITIVSMFTILEEGLNVKSKLETGAISRDNLSASQIEVLREEDTFLYALNIRAKFLPAFALSRISGIADASLFEKAKMLYFKWNPDFLSQEKMNLEEIIYATEILRKAQETKNLLQKCGVKVELDKKVHKIFKNMNRGYIKQDKLQGEALTRANLINRSLGDFYQSLDEVLK